MAMSFIFIFFFLSYGGIHYYFYCRLKEALHPSFPVALCILVFLALMVTAPVMVHAVGRWGLPLSSRIFAYFCYSWMAFIFFFFCLSLTFDFSRLVVYLAGRFLSRDMFFLLPSPICRFLLTLLISLGILTYGFFEAGNIRTEKVVIKSAKLPPSLKRIRIVQISDLHIGMIMRGERLKNIIAKVKEAQPDILVATGDLVDGETDGLFTECELFQNIRPRMGKFAVTGNHEFYAGIDRALNFTRKAGFTILRGEGATVNGLINMAGFDDMAVWGRNSNSSRVVSFKKALAVLPPEKFTLLLYHRPIIENNSLGAYDLQLSGHTHKGQIFPFSFLTGLIFPRQAGLFTFPEGSVLYVNRGGGTWGPPVRFLAPPEITVIDLVPKK
jgi:predicted MPP superfamily phosphohydrolase